MNLGFDQLWWLLLLPVGLLPLLARPGPALRHPALPLIPADPCSRGLSATLRVVPMLAITSTVLALSGPYRPAKELERVGRGAQIVLLLDRSRSMDEPFYTRVQPAVPLMAMPRGESKGAVARRLLSEFVSSRQDDMFAMIAFSSHPIVALPFTQKQDIVQAAIAAGGVGSGLAETDVGVGLSAALRLFERRPFVGSRIILLVSDGATRVGAIARDAIATRLRRGHVVLYWIYIRTRHGVGLEGDPAETGEEAPPQRALHRFFMDSGVPYRVYTAEDPDALRRAIADVGRLQRLPIRYLELQPRQDLGGPLYGLTASLLAILILVRVSLVRVW